MLTALLKQLRRIASGLREKATASVEECELEHFLYYHGLVGTSPDDQRQFRDVRQDIFDAVRARSSNGLAIALRLPPLCWEDKLKTIFGEMPAEDRQAAISLLDSDSGEPAGGNLIEHEDWRVRANTAMLLAYLDHREAVGRLASALHSSTTDPQRPAFCHIARALAGFKTPQARMALTAHLASPEPWFRVDAVSALSAWPVDDVASDLMRAMLDEHRLSDYAAVAAARRLPIADLLNHETDDVREGALETIGGVLKAAGATFSAETFVDCNLLPAWGRVRELAMAGPSPRRIRVAVQLATWLLANMDGMEAAGGSQEGLTAESLRQTLELLRGKMAQDACLGLLAAAAAGDPAPLMEVRHAIKLSGELSLAGSAAHIEKLLKPDFALLDDSIEALGGIGAEWTGASIVRLAGEIVDVEGRLSPPKSPHPVFEDSPERARTYWLMLAALGRLPSPESAALLARAVDDFAPDKRQQALDSLVSVAADSRIKHDIEATVRSALARGLKDPSPAVRMSALRGVGSLGMTDLIAGVLDLLNTREVSLRNAAAETIRSLSASGRREQVIEQVTGRLRGELSARRRERLASLLSSL